MNDFQTIITAALQSSPIAAVLGTAVVILWRRLVERDKKMEDLLERYHQDSQQQSELLRKIFDALDDDGEC